jgi:TRAP-type C4-dicarboxylate transport system permease small subunit
MKTKHITISLSILLLAATVYAYMTKHNSSSADSLGRIALAGALVVSNYESNFAPERLRKSLKIISWCCIALFSGLLFYDWR